MPALSTDACPCPAFGHFVRKPDYWRSAKVRLENPAYRYYKKYQFDVQSVANLRGLPRSCAPAPVESLRELNENSWRKQMAPTCNRCEVIKCRNCVLSPHDGMSAAYLHSRGTTVNLVFSTLPEISCNRRGQLNLLPQRVGQLKLWPKMGQVYST